MLKAQENIPVKLHSFEESQDLLAILLWDYLKAVFLMNLQSQEINEIEM